MKLVTHSQLVRCWQTESYEIHMPILKVINIHSLGISTFLNTWLNIKFELLINLYLLSKTLFLFFFHWDIWLKSIVVRNFLSMRNATLLNLQDVQIFHNLISSIRNMITSALNMRTSYSSQVLKLGIQF